MTSCIREDGRKGKETSRTGVIREWRENTNQGGTISIRIRQDPKGHLATAKSDCKIVCFVTHALGSGGSLLRVFAVPEASILDDCLTRFIREIVDDHTRNSILNSTD